MQQVLEHRVDRSRLWRIHGRYYDLAPFLSKHPGGDAIALGRGKDCTALWESVHCLTDVPSRALARFQVDGGSEDGPDRYGQDIFRWDSAGFYRTVQRRVREHFARAPGNSKAPAAFYVRWFLLLGLWMLAVYLGLWRGSWGWAALGGFTMEVLDLTVTHDGSHSAIARRPWINKLASYTQFLYFWSHPIWLHHHVYAHHSYTGVQGLDPDLDNNVLQRKHRVQPLRFWHRIQALATWLYVPWLMSVLQSLVYLGAAFTRTPIFGVEFRLTARDWLHHLSLWLLTLVVHFVIPFWLLPASQALLVLAAYYASQGLWYFLTVAPNHDTYATVLAGDTSLTVEQLKAEPMDWGEKQVRATANFTVFNETWSRWLNPVLGGMHYQIEHHLFPAVSHCHYPALSSIVRQTCSEFGIPYRSPTWLVAMRDYHEALRQLGRSGDPSASPTVFASAQTNSVLSPAREG